VNIIGSGTPKGVIPDLLRKGSKPWETADPRAEARGLIPLIRTRRREFPRSHAVSNGGLPSGNPYLGVIRLRAF